MQVISRLIAIVLFFIISAFFKPAFASGPSNHSEFFRDFESINLQVVVTSDEVATSFWYGFDEKELKPPINRSEIQASVFRAFREMFSESGMKITGDETKEEREKLQKEYEKKHPPKPPGSDPFDFSDYVPTKPQLAVTVFVVLNRFVKEDGSQIIYGAITAKTRKDAGKRRTEPSAFLDPNFPIIFVLPEEKSKAGDMIKTSTKRAYEMQSRWILCTKIEGMSCVESQSEFMEKWKKKYWKNENQTNK